MSTPRLSTALGLLWREKWLLIGSVSLLAQARLVLSLSGFGDPPTRCRAICEGPPCPPALSRRIGWSINQAARVVPGATCLVAAMAARKLLALKGYSSAIRVGVRASEGASFEAHAWLVSGDRIVVGGSEAEVAGYAAIVGAS